MSVATRIAAMPAWRSTRSPGDLRPPGTVASNAFRDHIREEQEANVTTKKQKARAAAAGKDAPTKPKPKKKTSRGK